MNNQPNGYLSPKLVGLKRSDDERGVFAKQPISQGECLAVWGGTIMTATQLRQQPLLMQKLSVQVDEDAYLVSFQEGPADWMNHSCNPNAGLQGQISVIALRDIAIDEEICFDYAMSDGSPYDEFDCRCGSPHCRGRITGNDWQRSELWERYYGYFSPYLQRRIELLQYDKIVSSNANL